MRAQRAGSAEAVTVTVDPVRCAAHGLCAVILDEHVSLDEWGFPVVDATAVVERRLVRRARRAARACPRRALLLNQVPLPETASTVSS